MAKLIVLWAKECLPCATLKSDLREAGVAFTAMDVDTGRGVRLAERLGVEYVPAVFIRDGDRYVAVRATTARGIASALRRFARSDGVGIRPRGRCR